MIPAAIVGMFFNDEINKLFEGALTLVGGMLLVTGLLLFLADKSKASAKQVGIKDAILVGKVMGKLQKEMEKFGATFG